MNIEKILWLAIGACVALALVFVSTVSAERIEIGQNDWVYMNETVDISLAVAYPDFQVVWCNASNYDCDPPDQVIDITGNMHKYYIDPAIFHYGKYYRWDGEWHRAENADAFTVMPGIRPIITNETNWTGPNFTPIPMKYGPYKYVIARGDAPEIYTVVNRSDPCHLWLFTNTVDTLNIDMDARNSTRYHKFTTPDTYSMNIGTYTGYLQFNGANKMQDVFLDKDILDTPYDDSMVKDVPIITWKLDEVKNQFDTLAKEVPQFDDVLTPIILVVEEPDITITEVTQDEDKLWISGITNWDNKTNIKIELDPDNYVLPIDKKLHTWSASVLGDIDSKRTFSTAVKINREELYIGTHELVMTVDKLPGFSAHYNFQISDVYVMPTPTPVIKRMVLTDRDDPIPAYVAPTITRDFSSGLTPTPTWKPTPIRTSNLTYANGSPYVTTPTVGVVTTENRTSNITPTGTHDSNIYLPIPVWVPALAMLTVLLFRRKP
jgi:hypothetical protein